MTQAESTTLRLKVPASIAGILKPGAPRDAQLAAAQGALPLSGRDLLVALFFLCRNHDDEVRKAAVRTLRQTPSAVFVAVIEEDPALPPQLLDLLARARFAELDLMSGLVTHPATAVKTLLFLAEKGGAELLEHLARQQRLLQETPGLTEALLANSVAPGLLRILQDVENEPEENRSVAEDAALPEESEAEDVDEAEGREQAELQSYAEEAEREGMSKYQIAMELKVSEKIKMGLTGDKEWRSLMIKESNKLIQGAVMKNPRITDGEVLMVVKNKTCSDEIIRAVLLNKEWLKNYEIKKALVVHPKTPPPKAMRFVSFLTMRDIKDLAKSRQVSRIVSTAARKELELRLKKMGG